MNDEDRAFDEIMSWSSGQVDDYLRRNGYDPEQIRVHGKILIDTLKKNMIQQEALQRIAQISAEWEKQQRKDAPFWNLGDIARAVLKKIV